MCQLWNKQPPLTVYLILNSKNFVIILISSNKHFFYGIAINLGIRHTAFYEL